MIVALLLTKLRLGVHACRVMQQNQECIPNVLALFLGDTGIGHPDEVCSICLQSTDPCCVKAAAKSCKLLKQDVIAVPMLAALCLATLAFGLTACLLVKSYIQC